MKITLSIATIIFTICFPGPSFALIHNWKLSYADKDYSIYYDPSSIEVRVNAASIWTIIDLKDGTRDWASAKSHYIFSCDERNGSINQTLYYSGHMGSGRLLQRTNSESVYAIVPSSASESLYKVACVKSKHLRYQVPEF